MKCKIAILTISLLLCTVGSFFTSCDSVDVAAAVLEIDTAAVDSILAEYDLAQGPGASAMVIHQGQVVFSKGYGLANLAMDTPVSAVTNFRLASITKQFTAMCIMILYSRGQLDYEQALTDIFPDFPGYGDTITLRHMLHHTSGLRDYFGLIPDTVTQQLRDQDVMDMMMDQNSTYFIPGTEYRYSNSGYALLALVVERISGQSFANFLHENIFLPLEMNGTVAHEEGISTIFNRAYGYTFSNGAYVPNDQSITSAVLGDGGIYSSTTDMAAWDHALYTAQLVPYDVLNEAFISGTLISGSEIGYGFGWVLDTYLYRNRVSHTGSTTGFKNVYQRYPDADLSIIVLTNRSSGSPKDIANGIAQTIL